MDILIAGKNKKKTAEEWKEINKNNVIGQYYSADRYFTLLNEFIDTNLKKYAKLVFFVISYLMRSTNFKHETSIANGKTLSVWLVDIFCWICCAVFLGCTFAGVATPIINAIKKVDVGEIINSTLNSGLGIGLLVTAIFTFTVAALYIYMMTKVVAKNKALNLQDYVFKKINYILKMSFMFDFRNKFFKVKESETVILEKVDELNNVNRWITLQITNLMFKLFANFDIILRFENIDDDVFEQMKKIIIHDFKNLEIIDITEPKQETETENKDK